MSSIAKLLDMGIEAVSEGLVPLLDHDLLTAEFNTIGCGSLFSATAAGEELLSKTLPAKQTPEALEE